VYLKKVAAPPTKVEKRAAAAAEPKHPVRRRRPNIIGMEVYVKLNNA